MSKIIFLILLILVTLSIPTSIFAQSPDSGSSAKLNTEKRIEEKIDTRPLKLKSFLKRFKSPLTGHADFIVKVSDAYQIPWTIITAISGVESTFCHQIPVFSYNCWGWNNGAYYFLDFEDGIYTVAKGLKYGYFDKGLTNPYLINRVYAPPSQVWGSKVQNFMNQIENTELTPIPAVSL